MGCCESIGVTEHLQQISACKDQIKKLNGKLQKLEHSNELLFRDNEKLQIINEMTIKDNEILLLKKDIQILELQSELKK